MRVVSLVPSVTETLVSWGMPPVACTRFCERPELPHVGGTKNPDIDAIVALRPDVVAMCVEENRQEDAAALERAGVRVVALSIDGIEDVAPALQQLVPWLSSPAARDAAARTRAALAEVAADVRADAWVRAFVPIWRRPWMTSSGGTYGSSLLERLGVVNVFADATERYPTITLEDAAARCPDVVLAPSEPYPFSARHVPELQQVAPVVLVDGQDLFWWGSRTLAALIRLQAQIETHPG